MPSFLNSLGKSLIFGIISALVIYFGLMYKTATLFAVPLEPWKIAYPTYAPFAVFGIIAGVMFIVTLLVEAIIFPSVKLSGGDESEWTVVRGEASDDEYLGQYDEEQLGQYDEEQLGQYDEEQLGQYEYDEQLGQIGYEDRLGQQEILNYNQDTISNLPGAL